MINNTNPVDCMAICAAINKLVSNEADSITIVSDNADFDGPNNIIFCNGDWTKFEDMRFAGDSFIDCLTHAVNAKENK